MMYADRRVSFVSFSSLIPVACMCYLSYPVTCYMLSFKVMSAAERKQAMALLLCGNMSDGMQVNPTKFGEIRQNRLG